MAKALFVFNYTRNCFTRLKQAERAVENCAAAWIEGHEGLGIRLLNPLESREARQRQIILAEKLPPINGCHPRVVDQVPEVIPHEERADLIFSAKLFADKDLLSAKAIEKRQADSERRKNMKHAHEQELIEAYHRRTAVA